MISPPIGATGGWRTRRSGVEEYAVNWSPESIKHTELTLERQRKADLFVKGNVSCRRFGSYGVPPDELQ